MISSHDALLRLREGNARFASDTVEHGSRDYRARRKQLVAGQEPFAIVVGCSDSRVPVEIVFDQGLGDLFVIRTAGNVVSKTQLASVEFAVGKYGVKLIVVLGHTGCGAMEAAIGAVRGGGGPGSGGLRPLVEKFWPAAEHAIGIGASGDGDTAALVDIAARENVRNAVGDISGGSAAIGQLVEDGELVVVGAEYCLATGVVEFF
jgi:carbonic anhydrase